MWALALVLPALVYPVAPATAQPRAPQQFRRPPLAAAPAQLQQRLTAAEELSGR